MKSTSMSLLALCSGALLAQGCAKTTDDTAVLAKATISATGALVNSKGTTLRAAEDSKYAGHYLELRDLGKGQRIEQLVSSKGEVVRERKGTASEARAATQEQNQGADCTTFADADGNTVADSCAVPGDSAGGVHCERMDVESSANTTQVCAVCYDDQGNVVSRECHVDGQPGTEEPPVGGECPAIAMVCQADADCPANVACRNGVCDMACPPPPCVDANDSATGNCQPPPVQECRLTHENGATCKVCRTADGGEFRECYPDPDPTRCEIVSTDDGLACAYCYDAAGVLVDRACRPLPCPAGEVQNQSAQLCTSDNECRTGRCVNGVCEGSCQPPAPPTRCEAFESQDGRFCEVCYDEAGNVIEQRCNEVPPPVQCREYREADGRACTICADDQGNIVRRDCVPAPCAMPVNDMPAACASDQDCGQGLACVDGSCTCSTLPPACRLYQTLNGFLCEICGDQNGDGVEDLNDARCYPAPVDPITCIEGQSSDGQHCVVCTDPTGTTVEQRCDIQPPQPPRCVVQEGRDATGQSGVVCEICYDEAGNVIHNSCEQVTCESTTVTENGQTLACEQCTDASGVISRRCQPVACVDANGNCPPPPPPPCGTTSGDPANGSAGAPINCAQYVTVAIDPVQCGGNPWQSSDSNATDEMEQVKQWLLGLGVQVFALRFERVAQVTCAACSCSRGDRLFVDTDAAGAELLARYGFARLQ